MQFLQHVGKQFLIDTALHYFNNPDQGKLAALVKLLVDAVPEEQLLTVASEAVYQRYPFARPAEGKVEQVVPGDKEGFVRIVPCDQPVRMLGKDS